MSPITLHDLRFPLLILVSALFATACAKDSPVLAWKPLSPPEQELRERVQALRDIVWEGTTVTAIAGALLGGALGGAQGATRGAEAGRLAGAAAGRYVAQQRALHEDRMAMLRAVASDLEAVNAETAALVESMRAVVAQQRTELARRKDNLEVMKKGLATAQAQHALARDIRGKLPAEDSGDLGPINEEIGRHEQHISNMVAVISALQEST